MSTKKDKFSAQDIRFMRLAIKLARAKKGFTGDNPSVGCVIVKKNQIISIGQTGLNGRPHAETNAINNSFQNLSGSKMYVTLEPCTHYGQTPPCTKSIIKSGIDEVIYSINDIDKKVKGKSFKILNKKNIKVKRGLLKNEVKKLYKSYLVNRLNKMPYITGKIAVSKNNLIYSENQKRITNKFSEKLTHFLRYKNDAILITGKTLNIDNPRLTCRLKGYEKFSPKKIILDRKLEIASKSYIFKNAKTEPTIIFHNSKNKNKLKILKKQKIHLIRSDLKGKNSFYLKDILKKIYYLGVRSLLIEGGDKITNSFIKNNLFNEFYLFKSPNKLSKKKKYSSFTSLKLLNKKYDKTPKIRFKLFNDIITIYEK